MWKKDKLIMISRRTFVKGFAAPLALPFLHTKVKASAYEFPTEILKISADFHWTDFFKALIIYPDMAPCVENTSGRYYSYVIPNYLRKPQRIQSETDEIWIPTYGIGWTASKRDSTSVSEIVDGVRKKIDNDGARLLLAAGFGSNKITVGKNRADVEMLFKATYKKQDLRTFQYGNYVIGVDRIGIDEGNNVVIIPTILEIFDDPIGKLPYGYAEIGMCVINSDYVKLGVIDV